MLYNENFKAKYKYTVERKADQSLYYVREEIVQWALYNKISLKVMNVPKDYDNGYLEKLILYFESQEDMLALKLKFNV